MAMSQANGRERISLRSFRHLTVMTGWYLHQRTKSIPYGQELRVGWSHPGIMSELSDSSLPQASLVSGPLNPTTAFLAKVSTSSESDNPGVQQHLICVYISDVYDKPSVTEVSFCSGCIQNGFIMSRSWKYFWGITVSISVASNQTFILASVSKISYQLRQCQICC